MNSPRIKDRILNVMAQGLREGMYVLTIQLTTNDYDQLLKELGDKFPEDGHISTPYGKVLIKCL